MDCLKINVEASYTLVSLVTCIGGLCRSDNGWWLKGFRVKSFCNSSKEAEIRAILFILQWAREEGWTNISVT